MDGTIGWQRIEGAAILAAMIGLILFGGLPFAWWVAILVFFVPDLSFAAYLAGNRAGALAYNLFHVYALGVVVALAGAFWTDTVLIAVGLLWIAHVGFDRMLGYGLKKTSGFKHTHMGDL